MIYIENKIPSNITIGILGGGQLGLMLSEAARKLGYKTHIFANNKDEPALNHTDNITIADFNDKKALINFYENCDIITFEFENIPINALSNLNLYKKVIPNINSLKITQDRLLEKKFINSAGHKTTQFAAINSRHDIEPAYELIGGKGILKTRKFGYDGKGQFSIHNLLDLKYAWKELNEAPSILEKKIDFNTEISIIIARDKNGVIKEFDLTENIHKDGILIESNIPAKISNRIEKKSKEIGISIINKLNYIGVLAIEMFIYKDSVLINELAPRVHNSGHWTLDACETSQFEQHIRAITGMPLGATERHSSATMKNLIGNQVQKLDKFYGKKNTKIHIYGKKEVRPGRKMGHITILDNKE